MTCKDSNTDFQPHPTVHNFKNLTGQQFGRLRVLGFVGVEPKRPLWLCQCECGTQKAIPTRHLRSGAIRSCGCLRREVATLSNTTHGAAKTAEFRVWGHMRGRCSNPTDAAYANYGGRGIKVCERWGSFENFLADMGERPTPQHTIERKNNDKGYAPDNCIWASRIVQANNRRSSKSLTANGQTMTISAWAKHKGMPYHTLYDRLQRMSVEDALSLPLRRSHHTSP